MISCTRTVRIFGKFLASRDLALSVPKNTELENSLSFPGSHETFRTFIRFDRSYWGIEQIGVKICYKQAARLGGALEPPTSYHGLYHLMARQRDCQSLQIL